MSHQLHKKHFIMSREERYPQHCLRCDKILHGRNQTYFCWSCQNNLRARKDGKEFFEKLSKILKIKKGNNKNELGK